MFAYVTRRLIQSVFVIVIISLLIFIIIRILPGDPVLYYISKQEMSNTSEEQIALIRHQFGLDKPIIIQYFKWWADLSHGDLGKSMSYREDVARLLLQRIPVTLHLDILALIFSLIFGIAAGVVSALRRGKALDTVTTVLANIGITMPVFWLGILLIYLFGLKLHYLPLYGYTSPFTDFWQSTRKVILPVICLVIFPLASLARQTRSSMLEVIHQDYIRTAWSKGLSERVLVTRHAVKNALIPIVTLVGFSLSNILGGSVLIETVFSIPGMGRLSVLALLSQDYAIIQAVTTFTAVIIVLVNLIVDFSYGLLDPRIRYT